MKILIAILTLSFAVSAQALTVQCDNGAGTAFTGTLDLVTTSETDMVLRQSAIGTLTFAGASDVIFELDGEYLTLKKGAYYRDIEVNVLTVNGRSLNRNMALKISNDPALRTDAERNRVIIDGYESGVFSCSITQ